MERAGYRGLMQRSPTYLVGYLWRQLELRPADESLNAVRFVHRALVPDRVKLFKFLYSSLLDGYAALAQDAESSQMQFRSCDAGLFCTHLHHTQSIYNTLYSITRLTSLSSRYSMLFHKKLIPTPNCSPFRPSSPLLITSGKAKFNSNLATGCA